MTYRGSSGAADVRALLASGEPLAAYDRALDALGASPDDPELRYLSVLALARSGATESAERQFRVQGLEGMEPLPELAEDVPALGARLAKDRALAATGDRRRRLAALAAHRYASVFERTGGHFSGVNAATMALVAGDEARAADLARRSLAVAGRDTREDDAAAFWRRASVAEAQLLLGDVDAGSEALRAAAASPGDAPARRAVTRRQLRLVCELTGADPSLLEAIANPRVVHFCGHRLEAGTGTEVQVRQELGAVLAELDVGAGWGSLAAGGDLLGAEALLDRGASLHVVLPCAVDDFVAASVHPAGAEWIPRFRACLDRAASVTFATEDALLGHDVLFEYTSRRAMGEAVLHADRLDAEVVQVAVWDGEPAKGRVGTGADVEAWRATGRPNRIVALDGRRATGPPLTRPPGPDRVVRVLLFGDIKGFSRLREPELPSFFAAVMGELARVLDESDAVRYRNSWGDGLYVVLDDVVAAARVALALQTAVARIDHEALGLPADLRLRLGAHAGPVFAGHDPIRDEPTFFGTQVTRTARIEPRTPEGEVYATDAFAALVRFDAPADFACEYVGHVPTAKGYGTFPMYRLALRG